MGVRSQPSKDHHWPAIPASAPHSGRSHRQPDQLTTGPPQGVRPEPAWRRLPAGPHRRSHPNHLAPGSRIAQLHEPGAALPFPDGGESGHEGKLTTLRRPPRRPGDRASDPQTPQGAWPSPADLMALPPQSLGNACISSGGGDRRRPAASQPVPRSGGRPARIRSHPSRGVGVAAGNSGADGPGQRRDAGAGACRTDHPAGH